MSFNYEEYNPSWRETVNTSFYKNKKGLNKVTKEVLDQIISNSNYEDSVNINHLDRDFNSRYPKSYLQSISKVKEPHGTIRTYYDTNKTELKEIIEMEYNMENILNIIKLNLEILE
jgi:hypothetical protein